MTILRSGSASDVGRVRAVNEDRALESLTLFAVADGMGGHVGGEVAARTAIEVLQREFGLDPTPQGLVGAVRRANQAVWEHAHEDPDLRGMGTTLTAAALVATDDGDRLMLANVGDSRTYRFHDGTLTQLTRDHSVAEELVDRGELSAAEAAVHPHRHILTRALGVAPEVEVDVWQVSPEAGDRYLLCSDGLTNEVSSTRITGVLSSTPEPQAASETLVGMANEHGGNDNITVVVLDVLVGDDHAAAGTPAVDGAGMRAAVAPGAAAAGVAAGAAGAVSGEGARAGSPAPVEGHAPPAVAPDDAGTPSLLSRSGSDAISGIKALGERASETSTRMRSRRVTFRVLLFLLIVAAVVAGAFYVVRWYWNSSYYVQMHRGEVVVYQGRLGGFVGLKPRVVWRTGIPADQVPADRLPAVNHGVEESSFKNACNYVVNIGLERNALQQATTTTAPPPPPGAPPAPAPTTTTATTTTTTLPKGCR